MNTWFTSDTHYDHKNIVRGTSTWGDSLGQRTRNFQTLEEHNQVLVDNINKCAQKNDVLYHLGDFSFNNFDNIAKFRALINCTNVHLILGNHDHHILNNKLDIRNAFSSVNQILFKKIGGQTMYLSHFAHRVWDKSHHGTWHLHGHSHGTLADYQQWHYSKDADGNNTRLIIAGDIPTNQNGWSWHAKKFKCMDVGIDTHHEFRP